MTQDYGYCLTMSEAVQAGPNYVAALIKLHAWREAQKERKEQKA